ncbi:MAG TPA: OmpA family protein [Gammaproteobacteria bacterium]|nr:OmpA family protein [Gammaproteobacteria bacterium]
MAGALPAAAHAQEAQRGQAIASSDVLSQISMFNYREGPKSDLFFRGTPVAATAEGDARVEYQDGNAQISASVEKLPEPASLGPYTTYVLWALTPDGRAANQGVLTGPEGGKGKLQTSHGASQFALIVTAEPHFAVTVPSTMIALYNVADDVEGEASKVTTLTERADYSSLARIAIDDEASSAEIVQARYAIAIADAAGADRFAPEAYSTAGEKLAAAEAALQGKRAQRRTVPGLAREAVTAGEDARRAAMIASATSEAAEQQLAAAAAATESANAAAARTAATTAAATEVARASERERSDAARSDLLSRLNSALPTHESDRGLISEIGGVHFATGTADIDMSARESLARFSGIVASYPGLRFQVEGHTDSTGSVATNNELSLRRALAARDYLIAQGVAASSIDVSGLGLSQPIADNSTSEGRARNRRVEIVVSGGPLAVR